MLTELALTFLRLDHGCTGTGVTVQLRSLVSLTRRGPRPAGPPAGFDRDSRRFGGPDSEHGHGH